MLNKISLAALLLLTACNPSSPTDAKKDFRDKNFFFDLDKEVEQSSCAIKGEIPLWLSGTLLRNGPAKFQVGKERVQSYFDGLAMLHAFVFTPEKVLYSNRFLRSEQYYHMMVEGNLNFSGFAQDPCSKVFKNQKSQFIPQEMQNVPNAVVSVAEYAGQMVALTEEPLPVVFDTKTLATLGVFNYKDTLPQKNIFESAHPQYDPKTKETINYLTRFGEKSRYQIWKMQDQQASRELVGEVEVDLPAYMHSFALTEHYVILVQFPFVVDPLDLMVKNKPFIMNFKWKPERGTLFSVLDRSTGKLLANIKGEPFFAFHHVNAFENEGKIIMDIVTYPNADVIAEVAENLEKPFHKASLQRFTLSLDTAAVAQETLFDEDVEMPRVPATLTTQPYQYCYAVDYHIPTSEQDKRALYKIDVNAKRSKSWSEEGCFPGEPIFVPRPNGKNEDDGVVLSLVLDFHNHRSFLLILDAHDLKELARAETPYAIPVGLHGLWKN